MARVSEEDMEDDNTVFVKEGLVAGKLSPRSPLCGYPSIVYIVNNYALAFSNMSNTSPITIRTFQCRTLGILRDYKQVR